MTDLTTAPPLVIPDEVEAVARVPWRDALRHYAKERRGLSDWRNCEQKQGPKPTGFWVSVGDEWKTWCEDQCYEVERLEFEHRVTLAPDASILHLGTERDLDDFTREYGVPDDDYTYTFRIAWPTVAAKYSGIVISPYQWPRRMASHTFWYYGWDIASGCIWDRDAIASLEDDQQEWKP